MDLVLTAYALAEKLPGTERFGLGSQIRRAAVSIPSNIAEGHAAGARQRYLNHVRIAVGSLAELDTQIDIATRLAFLSAEDVGIFAQQLTRTGQLLHGLARSLHEEPRYRDVEG
jgi:four helix bundle protein